jgi:hypothetical protein
VKRIAIVDEAPLTQYLYPEFVLFQRLFERAGIEAVICDPQALAFRDGALWAWRFAHRPGLQPAHRFRP